MEDFDVFTNEIDYTEPAYKNMLNKFVKDIPYTPSGPNYESKSRELTYNFYALYLFYYRYKNSHKIYFHIIRW